MLERNWFALY